jgi:CRP-like cAMP-binding protein
MEERLYGPGEIIYNENDEDDKIYFLLKGEIELFVEN